MDFFKVLLQYILAIFGLSLIVFVHELGHFIFARISGMYVSDFFIGFGPKLFKFKSKSGTNYGVNIIPFGGYCRILGMTRSEDIPEDKKDNAFFNKPFFKKFFTIIGGVGMNAVFTVILIGIFLSMGVFTYVNVVDYIEPGTPAEICGIKEGDKVIALNDEIIGSWEDFSTSTKRHPGEKVIYTVVRNGEEIKIEVELENLNNEGFLGIGPKAIKESMGFIDILKESFIMTWDIGKSYIKLFGMLFSGQLSFEEARPVSPIGVISIFQQSAAMGIQNFILFMALVSLLIAFGNLLPILPVDGGQLVVITFEAIRRRPISRKVFEIYNTIGIVFIISIFVVAIVFDIIKPFNLQNM